MKRNKTYKILTFLPAVAIMTCIFIFSAQDSTESSNLSDSVTYALVSGFDKVFHTIGTEQKIIETVKCLNGFVRKMAHFTEYALLGISLILPICLYNLKRKSVILLTLIICVFYSISDEFHQLFVPGRYGCLKDVFIDSSGALLGILVVDFFKYNKKS